MRSSRASAAHRPMGESSAHRHISGLLVALIMLCCVGFLVVYYKIDSDYANQSGDFNRLERRLEALNLKADAASKADAPAARWAMPVDPSAPVPVMLDNQ